MGSLQIEPLIKELREERIDGPLFKFKILTARVKEASLGASLEEIGRLFQVYEAACNAREWAKKPEWVLSALEELQERLRPKMHFGHLM